MSLITTRSPNLRTRSLTSITGESVGIGLINNDEIRMTKSEGKPKCERRITTGFSSFRFSRDLGIRHSTPRFLLVSPNRGEDQIQFSRLRPELSRFRFEFRHRANNHSKEVFRFARLFPTGADVLKKFLLRYS